MPCAVVLLILLLIAVVYWSLIIAFVHSHDEVIEERLPGCATCGYSRVGRAEDSPCPECGEVTPATRVKTVTRRTLEPARLVLFLGAVATALLYGPIRDIAAGSVQRASTQIVSASSSPLDWTVGATWHFALYLAYAGGLVRPVPFQRAMVNTSAFCATNAVVCGLIGVVMGRAADKPAAEAIGLICSGIVTGGVALAVSGGLCAYSPGARTSV